MSLRDNIVANALWGVAHESQIHYREYRPMDGLDEPFKLPLTIDCSGFATLCYRWAGAPDPNGLDYNGQGYTGSLLGLEHIDQTELQPADLVVFGPGTGDHVVIVIDTAADPTTVSHGQESGPLKIRLSTEARAHRPPVTCLRGAGLDTPPQPDEDDQMTPELTQYLADMEARLSEHFTEVMNHLGKSEARPDGTYDDEGIEGSLHKARRAIKKTFAQAGGTGDPEA